MAPSLSTDRTHAFALMTLVVLQEHAYALPAPWALLVDAVVALNEERHASLKARSFGLPKFEEIPVVGDKLKNTPIGDKEIGTPQQVAAQVAAEEIEKKVNKDQKPADAKPRQPPPKPKEQEPKPNSKEDQDKGGGQRKEGQGSDKGKDAGMITGTTIGIFFALLVIVLIVVWYLRKRRRIAKENEAIEGADSEQSPPYTPKNT